MPMTTVPLAPKNAGGKLNVVAIGRISTVQQDYENIEASHRYVQNYLGHIYQGPLQIKLLGEQASGMLTDRATIREAEDLVATGKVDLVIAEDLARIYRNPRHQYVFVQDCVDVGTRVICVGDNLDTADENWEITMGAAALRHGLHIPDTRRRVRRTATHCFHNGGMVQKIRYGYRKLTKEEAVMGVFGPKNLRITRLPECTPIIHQMMDRVMRGERYAAVAEWLEAEGIEPGTHVESGHWSAKLVVELLDDPILSGTRTFRDAIYRPIFKTGKHKATKNPQSETAFHPELAHLSIDEHEALHREIARRRDEQVSRKRVQRSRSNMPRTRSLWPGQAVTCGVCGGLMYYMGSYLKCRNSLPGPRQSCWNHVQVPAALTRERVLAWLMQSIDNNDAWRHAMVEVAWSEVERRNHQSTRCHGNLQREIAAMERQAGNLAAAIAAGGQLQTLVQKLQSVEQSLQQARAAQTAESVSHAGGQNEILSREHVEANLSDTLCSLLHGSCHFADWMRQLVPIFVVHPVQALDSGQVRPRAILTARWRAAVGVTEAEQGKGAEEDVEVILDLFEPPLHIRHLPQCVAAKQEHPHLSLKGIAQLLGINHMTVKRAFDYARRMQSLGMTNPYCDLVDRPNASRWRQRCK
jgi:site-specific DNA recombinase